MVTNMLVSSGYFKGLGSWAVWMRGELEGLFCCGLIWVALGFRVYGCVWFYLDSVNQKLCGEIFLHLLSNDLIFWLCFLQMNFALLHSDQQVEAVDE